MTSFEILYGALVVLAWGGSLTVAGVLVLRERRKIKNPFNQCYRENRVEKIMKRSPETKLELLLTIERIGRREIYPRLLLEESKAAKRVLDMGLSYETQAKIYENPIPVAVRRKGAIETEYKHISELTAHEACNAITEEGVKPLEQQVKDLKAKASREVLRYKVSKEGITFFAKTTLTWSQIAEILARRPKESAVELKTAILGNQLRKAA